MFISIHDVPAHERHLLFCSRLDHARHRRRRVRHEPNLPVSDHSLMICHVQPTAEIADRGRLE